MLAEGEVHYAGQIIYVVVAKMSTARAAMKKAVIDITPEDPVLTIDDALNGQISQRRFCC